MHKDYKKFLLDLGVKEKLFKQLDKKILLNLVSFAMDHIKAPNISQLVTQLGSMELHDKKGASVLACEGIATVEQLKTLTAEQIQQVCADYEFNKDLAIAVKNVKKMVISNQQEKLYFASGGLKGEYYLYKDDGESDEEFTK